MPHMKYFQGLADIRNHYDEILKHYDNPKWGTDMLVSWGINVSEKELIKEEREVLRYLIGCQRNLVFGENSKKPRLDVVQRCFNRHLDFLDKIHGCRADNANKHRNELVRKQYKTCRHYLFQFSLPAWYEKLPIEILTFENKYSSIEEEDIAIPQI